MRNKGVEKMSDIFESNHVRVQRVRTNWNDTDYVEQILKKYCPSHHITKDNNPTYDSGKYFERIVGKWCKKVLHFEYFSLSWDLNCPIFTENGEWEIPMRIFKTEVPYYSTLNRVYEKQGRELPRKKFSKTEFVFYAKDARPTAVFPISCFNDNGSLDVRVELKTQNVAGTAYKKNEAAIPELHFGSPEKNIIFLMTGNYYEKDHYDVAKYHADRCNKKDENKKIVVMNEKEFVEWSLQAYPNTK
jgi:hypothetical protein